MSELAFFYIFGGITVLSIFLMILQTNPVVSAVFLVFGFFGLAALYVLLAAPFVAALQVLVYAGAIMVLFIFVIMLLDLRKEELAFDKFNVKRFVFVVIMGLAFLGVFAYVYCKQGPWASLMAEGMPPLIDGFGEPKSVGRLLFVKYLIPFELVSILLLVAIVGAVMLAKKDEK